MYKCLYFCTCMDVDRKTLGDIGLSVNRCSFNFTNLTNNSDLSK